MSRLLWNRDYIWVFFAFFQLSVAGDKRKGGIFTQQSKDPLSMGTLAVALEVVSLMVIGIPSNGPKDFPCR